MLKINNVKDLQPLILDYSQGRQYDTNVMINFFIFGIFTYKPFPK